MARETFLESTWSEPPAFSSKGLILCPSLLCQPLLMTHCLSWPHILLTTCFVQINCQMVMFLPAPSALGKRKSGMMASLLVHSSSAPSSVSCEPALGQGSALKSSLSTQQECKKQGKAYRSVAVTLLWLTLTISSPELWTYATTGVSLFNGFERSRILSPNLNLFNKIYSKKQ